MSDTGTLAYVAAGAIGLRHTLVWVDRQGQEEPLSAEARAYRGPAVSPDGTRVAVGLRETNEGPPADVWIWYRPSGPLTRLTLDDADEGAPVWTPDGQRVVFTRPESGLYWQTADGTGQVERLLEGPNTYAFDWSADGRLFFDEVVDGGRDIGVLTPGGASAKEMLLTGPFSQGRPNVSPDGRWLAYNSNESGQDEVYVRPFPDVDTVRWPVSTSGGTEPRWSPDGGELFYLDEGAATMMVSRIDATETFSAATPEALFDVSGYVMPSGPHRYDIAPDGRFLMIKEDGGLVALPQMGDRNDRGRHI